jgi:hypothetical protein
MGETIREGGCACGAMRYRLKNEPIYVNNCHCRQCQRQTGSTSVVNAFTEAENFEVLQGESWQHTVKAGSGGPHTIFRCSECGTAIYSQYPRFGPLGIGVRVGTLDDPGSLTPDATIFIVERMPWVTLPEGIPHFESYYDPPEILPPARAERFRELWRRREAGEGF